MFHVFFGVGSAQELRSPPASTCKPFTFVGRLPFGAGLRRREHGCLFMKRFLEGSGVLVHHTTACVNPPSGVRV